MLDFLQKKFSCIIIFLTGCIVAKKSLGEKNSFSKNSNFMQMCRFSGLFNLSQIEPAVYEKTSSILNWIQLM